jgi:adenylate kinase
MILVITGTPGTGKTSVCKACGLECMGLNSVIAEKGFYTGVDPQRGSFIADLDKLDGYVRHKEERLSVVIAESHLAHLLKPDVAIVLRAKPSVLTERLKQKGFSPQKIQENAEAETLDIILAEAVELCDIVYEVDTTGKSVEDVAAVVRAIIDAEVESEEESGSERRAVLRKKYKPGSVDWTRFIEQVCSTVPYHYDEE